MRLDDKDLKSQKYLFLTFSLVGTLLLLIFNSLLYKAFAISPAFSDKEIFNQKNDWVQTYGNHSTHLRSDYANLLAVDYSSDGKTLDVTFWLASNSKNASIYNQPLRHIRYGMLISIASLPFNSGYNGANYDFYIEASNGKWSEYLYRMSPTGTRELIYSKANFTESFGGPELGPGYVKLRLNLDSINSPSIYGLSFYTSKSLQSNEVRDFTAWVAVPPHDIDVVTNPKDMAIRQGEELLIPPKIFNTFSNAVTSIKFFNGKNTSIKFFNSSGLTV